MNDAFILNPNLNQLEVFDAINENLTKAKSITSCLLANGVDTGFSNLMYGAIWAVDEYLGELEILHDQMSKELNITS